MDPPLPADTDAMEREEADKDAKRKIQFSVPSSVPVQLDPRQVEMVRAEQREVMGGVNARTEQIVVFVWKEEERGQMWFIQALINVFSVCSLKPTRLYKFLSS